MMEKFEFFHCFVLSQRLSASQNIEMPAKTVKCKLKQWNGSLYGETWAKMVKRKLNQVNTSQIGENRVKW